jgi:hypothetical protein
MRGLDPRIHQLFTRIFRGRWIAGSSPLLSGSILVDRVHDVDSSVF